MSDREDTEIYAWVNEADAGEAYLATMATIDPLVLNDVRLRGTEADIWTSLGGTARTLEETLSATREALSQGHQVGTTIPILFPAHDRLIAPGMVCRFPRHRGGGHGCLLSVNEDHNGLMPQAIESTPSRVDLSVPVSAVILGREAQDIMETVFLALCAPDGHSRVRTGAYNMLDKLVERYHLGNDGWRAPLEMAATYHGDHLVARDVAISWLYLHDGDYIDSLVALSLDALMARVEATRPGTRVGISSQTWHIVKHGCDERRVVPIEIRSPVNTHRGPRKRFRQDDNLTREQVLATLQTPSETLIQALEGVAATDAEWLEAEKLALEWLAVKKTDEPIRYLYLDQIQQRNFLEQHAPFHVRRLPNGGVMLATHPYRYLWPLWAKALDLLGIRPKTA